MSAVAAMGINGIGFISGAIQNAVVGAISNQVQAGMNYAFLDQPYTFNWNDFLMQTATSAVVGGITGEIKARHLKSLSRQGNIEKNISLGTENYREKLSSNEIGRIGERQVITEFEAEGGEYINSHLAYRVDGVDGYGFTDIVGRKGDKLYIIESKNGKNPRFTPFQKKAFPKMKEKNGIMFFGPKSESSLLTDKIYTDYIFEIRRHRIY